MPELSPLAVAFAAGFVLGICVGAIIMAVAVVSGSSRPRGEWRGPRRVVTRPPATFRGEGW